MTEINTSKLSRKIAEKFAETTSNEDLMHFFFYHFFIDSHVNVLQQLTPEELLAEAEVLGISLD